MSSAIIHSFNGIDIRQFPDDGYIHATPMCKAHGKKFNGYFRLKSTQEYLGALSSVARIHATDLVRSSQGGDPKLQGTWVHPKVAIHLAQWCSPEFAVFVSNLVYDWISDHAASTPSPDAALAEAIAALVMQKLEAQTVLPGGELKPEPLPLYTSAELSKQNRREMQWASIPNNQVRRNCDAVKQIFHWDERFGGRKYWNAQEIEQRCEELKHTTDAEADRG